MPPIRRRGGGPKNRQARLSGGDTVPPAPTATVDAPGGAVRRLVYCRHALAFVETDHGHNALRRVPFGDELHEAPVVLVLSLYSSMRRTVSLTFTRSQSASAGTYGATTEVTPNNDERLSPRLLLAEGRSITVLLLRCRRRWWRRCCALSVCANLCVVLNKKIGPRTRTPRSGSCSRTWTSRHSSSSRRMCTFAISPTSTSKPQPSPRSGRKRPRSTRFRCSSSF